MAQKYRGKYTNARDCRHAETTEGLMVMVQVRETCPLFRANRHNLVETQFCQYHCKKYEKAAQAGKGGQDG